MIHDLSNKEKLINEFMKACREWLEAGKPTSDIFREDRAICESLDFFLAERGKPVFIMEWHQSHWMGVCEVKKLLKGCFSEAGLDNVYPFNHHVITNCDGMGPDDHYCVEIHKGTVWENKGRVYFVMNFKPLVEIAK